MRAPARPFGDTASEFTMTRRDRGELAAILCVPESELGDYTPRFNIAPTNHYVDLTSYDCTVFGLPDVTQE